MLNNIRRILFRDKRGIALASVMIIFIVAVILVTGISTAIAAQANIIKSRESVSQAHYYAYSAVNSVLTALTDEDVVIKSVPVGDVNLNGLFPTGEFDAVKTYITQDKIETNKYKITAEIEKKGQKAVSEVNITFNTQNITDSPSSWIIPKAPLAFIEIANNGLSNPEGVKVIDGDFNQTYTDPSLMNDYKINKMPSFSFKFNAPKTTNELKAILNVSKSGFSSYPNYTLDYTASTTKTFDSDYIYKNKFISLPNVTEITINAGNKTKFIDTFIYAPQATSITIDLNKPTIDNFIIYAPLATLNFSGNKFEGMAKGFFYANNITFDKQAQGMEFEGVMYAQNSFNITNDEGGNNNGDVNITGALITGIYNAPYKTKGNANPTTFETLPEGKKIDDYLLGFFKYTNPDAIIIGDGGGGSSVKYVIDPSSIVYKK